MTEPTSGKRLLAASTQEVLEACKHTAKKERSPTADADAALMFLGWHHYCVGLLTISDDVGEADIEPMWLAATQFLNKEVPEHGLAGDFYVRTLSLTRQAVEAGGGAPGRWSMHYYELVKGMAATSRVMFVGTVLQQTMSFTEALSELVS